MLEAMRVSMIGLILAGVYATWAGWVVMVERVQSGGGWITLRHMGSFLITLPVAAPLSWMGVKLNFDRDGDAVVAIGGCSLLVYGLGYLGQAAYFYWTKG